MRDVLHEDDDRLAEAARDVVGLRAMDAVAKASLVNRTHRVIRERAKSMQATKSQQRSLWFPLTVSGGLLAVLVCAVWSVLDQYEETAIGLPDASQQMLVLMMWCLPVSAAILGAIWMRRAGGKADRRSAR